ncbi:MAG TPA: hypothetical protein VI387_04870, partial [Candidatus Brocadiales bacterium]|nr:hypothetical protein [Candidatus Brocadiales bacterium]
DITLWSGNEEIKPYEEGAREKNIITCPINTLFPFLISGHDYMFKQALLHKWELKRELPQPPDFLSGF